MIAKFVILLALFPIVCTAADSRNVDPEKGRSQSSAKSGAPKNDAWRFKRVADKMTDKVSCHLNSPFGKLTFSLQGYVIYLVSNELLALRDRATLTVRVDKNQSISMYIRSVTPSIAAIDWNAYTEDWFSQMKTGKTLLVRVVSTTGAFEEEYSLRTFAPALAGYEGCRAALS